MWRNSATGEIYVWFMNGTTLASSGSVFTLADPAWKVVGTGDYDGNGKADIAWRNASTRRGLRLADERHDARLLGLDLRPVGPRMADRALEPAGGRPVPGRPGGRGPGAEMTFTVSRRGAPKLSAPAPDRALVAPGQGHRTHERVRPRSTR